MFGSMDQPLTQKNPDVIEAVVRSLGVLELFSAQHPALTLTEVATLAGMSRGTARRILITFESIGLVRQDGRKFHLTPRVLRLGYGYLSSLPTWDLAQRHMQALVEETNESSSLATLDGDDMVYIARIPSRRSMSITLAVGSRLPAYATSMGRVLIAGLVQSERDDYLARVTLNALTPRTIVDRERLASEIERVRQRGYCIVDGEREEGVRSIAAPIFDRAKQVIAALNISTNAGRVSIQMLRNDFLPRLLETAAAISADIALRPV
jgi:IclR family pca regulon transcriptional regulator